MALLLVVLLAALLLLMARAETGVINTRPGCQGKCGNISIPFPFGIGDGCSRDNYFSISCNSTSTPPKAYLGSNLDLIDISLLSGELRIKHRPSRDCYDRQGNYKTDNVWIDLQDKQPYTFSTRNRFTVLGCDTQALIGGTRGVSYAGGCISYCSSLVEGVQKGTCSGVGCCQTLIPKGLRRFETYITSFHNHSNCSKFNRCGYAFVVEAEEYRFDVSDLGDGFSDRLLPIVLDWSIGNQMCEEARQSADYECRSSNSRCVSSTKGVGYLCTCSEGYQGNPYLVDGCRNIDECSLSRNDYPCHGKCTDTPGGYNCTCPAGTAAEDGDPTNGDPKKGPCKPIPSKEGIPLSTKLAAGIGSGLVLLLATASCAIWGLQKRKYAQIKQNFFKQNGGLFLRQLSSQSRSTFRIYTEEELEKATNSFDRQQIIGRGGHGIVYKGTLEDGVTVAIKRSSVVNERQSKEFAREISFLSQLNHRNVVKLLGCCLEVEIPMLVYEFVPGGTLFNFIHGRKQRGAVASLDSRLRIASQSAEALAYLHSYASPPILHGDIKSSNILLDAKHMAKVSDFGASSLAPQDKAQFATVVQGTCGYLDPEFLQTCQLSEKSDVYSFGVVLAELLTGMKPLCFDAPEEEEDRSLTLKFVRSMKENRLREILDAQLVQDEEMDRLWEVAELTRQCLSVKGDDRPTMKEVAMALLVLAGGSEKLPPVPYVPEEAERLLVAPSSYSYAYESMEAATVNQSVEDQLIFDTRGGR